MHCESAEKLARLGIQSDVYIVVKFAGKIPYHLQKKAMITSL